MGDLESIIDRAIRNMPDSFVVKPFLKAHQAEVKGMLLTEYDEAEVRELFGIEAERNAAAAEAAGISKERREAITDLLETRTPYEICKELRRYPLEEVLMVQRKLQRSKQGNGE